MYKLQNVGIAIVSKKTFLTASQIIFLVLSEVNAFANNEVLKYHSEEQLLPKYKYSYNVHNVGDGQHGVQIFQKGFYTEGNSYNVKLNNGTYQNIEYNTDESGYHPKVESTNNLGSAKSETRKISGDALSNLKHSIAENIFISGQPASYKIENGTGELFQEVITSSAGTTKNNYYRSPTEISNFDNDYSSSKPDAKQFYNFNFPVSSQRNETNAERTGNKSHSEIDRSAAFIMADSKADGVYNPPPSSLVTSVELEDSYYPSADLNEITNGFLSKIASVLPEMIASKTKIVKPIIVTGSPNTNTDTDTDTNRRETELNVTGIDSIFNTIDVKNAEWPIVESATAAAAGTSKFQEYRKSVSSDETPSIDGTNETQTIDGEDIPFNYNFDTGIGGHKFENSKLEIEIEPQMLQEQAVITTTVDITKSLPLTMDFITETDNHIGVIGQPFNVVSPATQQIAMLPQSSIFFSSEPPKITYDTRSLIESQVSQNLPKPPNTVYQPVLVSNLHPPAPRPFHYVPIPVLQHQPNVIPLNYRYLKYGDTENDKYKDNYYSEEIVDSSNSNRNESKFTAKKEFSEQTKPTGNAPIVKNIYKPVGFESPSRKHVIKQQPIFNNYPMRVLELQRPPPFTVPYSINLPTTRLMPYIKQMKNPQQFLQSQPLLSQSRSHSSPVGLHRLSPKGHYSTSLNVNVLASNNRKAYQKSTAAPFKPSHPVWDSIYPPSHMYYVPYYVVDKLPTDGRKARDAFTTKVPHIRKLYIEYGGFKPPLIPSTLLDSQEPSHENIEKSSSIVHEKSSES